MIIQIPAKVGNFNEHVMSDFTVLYYFFKKTFRLNNVKANFKFYI